MRVAADDYQRRLDAGEAWGIRRVANAHGVGVQALIDELRSRGEERRAKSNGAVSTVAEYEAGRATVEARRAEAEAQRIDREVQRELIEELIREGRTTSEIVALLDAPRSTVQAARARLDPKWAEASRAEWEMVKARARDRRAKARALAKRGIAKAEIGRRIGVTRWAVALMLKGDR